MRLGVFGGSFDPVHFGHLLLAECCREQARLDEVWFVPTAQPPHKPDRHLSPAEQRFEMLQLALGGHASFQVSRLEIDRGGTSYTVDTLAAIAGDRPQAELCLLLGGDMLHDLVNWREPRRICELAMLVVVGRIGAPIVDAAQLAAALKLAPAAVRVEQVEMPAIELSSTDLRRRVAEGRSIRYRTPRAVEEFIAAHGLYRSE